MKIKIKRQTMLKISFILFFITVAITLTKVHLKKNLGRLLPA